MPVITEDEWQALAHAVRREIVSHFPDWSGSNAHDPGVTLIELFAFLAESPVVPRQSNRRARTPSRRAEALERGERLGDDRHSRTRCAA